MPVTGSRHGLAQGLVRLDQRRAEPPNLGTMTLPSESELRSLAGSAAAACGVDLTLMAGDHVGLSPVNGLPVSSLAWSSPTDVTAAVTRAAAAYDEWRLVPAPGRGAVVRRFGELLREHLDDLATLVTVEVGKITSEARGEVQEMVDICDYAVGLSRQLFGRTMTSERPGHRLMETWHPLGVVGVISAFNFPVAVWSWNTAIALVCGDPVVWKPSEQAPLCALASSALLSRALVEAGFSADVSQVVLGDAAVGLALVDDPAVALLSATGSTRMGREVGPRVAARFGRSLLELGGNSAAIVGPSADLDLTTRGIVFSAAGTAGQRCTTMRRVIAHSSVADAVVSRVAAAYEKLPIGSPLSPDTLVGPLVNERAHTSYVAAVTASRESGGELVAGGERVLAGQAADAYYVQPTVVRMPAQSEVVHTETFAPLLYVMTYDDLDEAIALANDTPYGLAAYVWTNDLRSALRAAEGLEFGMVGVNEWAPQSTEGPFTGWKQSGIGSESGHEGFEEYLETKLVALGGIG
jgi:aldehyde dehydrogenase (NAD+)